MKNNLERELNQGVREINKNVREHDSIADRIMAAIYTAHDYEPKMGAFAGQNIPRGYGRSSDIKEIYGTE